MGYKSFPVIIADGSEGHFRSPESALSFKLIPLTLLLISALLLTEIVLDLNRCLRQLLSFLIGSIILGIILRTFSV